MWEWESRRWEELATFNSLMNHGATLKEIFSYLVGKFYASRNLRAQKPDVPLTSTSHSFPLPLMLRTSALMAGQMFSLVAA